MPIHQMHSLGYCEDTQKVCIEKTEGTSKSSKTTKELFMIAATGQCRLTQNVVCNSHSREAKVSILWRGNNNTRMKQTTLITHKAND